MDKMRTFVAESRYGTFKRRSKTKRYRWAVVREDGWHMFSQTRETADHEAQYQRNKGRSVDIIPVYDWDFIAKSLSGSKA